MRFSRAGWGEICNRRPPTLEVSLSLMAEALVRVPAVELLDRLMVPEANRELGSIRCGAGGLCCPDHASSPRRDPSLQAAG